MFGSEPATGLIGSQKVVWRDLPANLAGAEAARAA